MIDLTGKTAIVTGGARGIGRGVALVLAQQGADVVIGDIDKAGAENTAADVEKLGRKAVALELDVTSKESVAALVSGTLESFGKIDILVNNAGVAGASGWWERATPNDEDWDFTLAVNLRGVVNVSEAVEPHMIERRYGKIINIASIAARQGSPDISHYSVSKAGVVSWTQGHALRLAAYDVNVNAICPGFLWTPMFEGLMRRPGRYGPSVEDEGLTDRQRFERRVEESIPMKKEQTPEDIGKLAAFLASDDAHNITGQAINVDGGRRMN